MSRHEDLVEVYVSRGARTRGFRRAVEDALGADIHMLDVPRRVPDAFTVTAEDGRTVIRVYEVVVTHPLSDEKLYDYAWVWSQVDSFCPYTAAFEVYVVGPGGDEYPVDMSTVYIKSLSGAPIDPVDCYIGMRERMRQAVDAMGAAFGLNPEPVA